MTSVWRLGSRQQPARVVGMVCATTVRRAEPSRGWPGRVPLGICSMVASAVGPSWPVSRPSPRGHYGARSRVFARRQGWDRRTRAPLAGAPAAARGPANRGVQPLMAPLPPYLVLRRHVFAPLSRCLQSVGQTQRWGAAGAHRWRGGRRGGGGRRPAGLVVRLTADELHARVACQARFRSTRWADLFVSQLTAH